MGLPHPGNRGHSCVLIPRDPYTEGQKTMIREMLGIAEGILQDLHNDHGEVNSLMDRIMESEDGAQRGAWAIVAPVTTPRVAPNAAGHAAATEKPLWASISDIF